MALAELPAPNRPTRLDSKHLIAHIDFQNRSIVGLIVKKFEFQFLFLKKINELKINKPKSPCLFLVSEKKKNQTNCC